MKSGDDGFLLCSNLLLHCLWPAASSASLGSLPEVGNVAGFSLGLFFGHPCSVTSFPESSEASLRCMTESCHVTHVSVQMYSPDGDAILCVVEEDK